MALNLPVPRETRNCSETCRVPCSSSTRKILHRTSITVVFFPPRFSNDLLFKTFDVLSTHVDPKTERICKHDRVKDASIYWYQWHPEKSNFEWSTTVDLPHSAHAVEVCHVGRESYHFIHI